MKKELAKCPQSEHAKLERGRLSLKDWDLGIANVVIEILSAALEQLASKDKLGHALAAMLLALIDVSVSCQHSDNPIKLSFWPILFASVVLWPYQEIPGQTVRALQLEAFATCRDETAARRQYSGVGGCKDDGYRTFC
ncbi:hypothetical protein V6N13_005772 [Hibiscus sabdariffa]